MSVETTEKESAAVAKNPDGRVKLADIEARIASTFYQTADNAVSVGMSEFSEDHPLARLTLCILVMDNGFVVVGKSAPLDPANFNYELGKKFAREDCIRQLWPLMAFSRLDSSRG